jgi:hypothetical protein
VDKEESRQKSSSSIALPSLQKTPRKKKNVSGGPQNDGTIRSDDDDVTAAPFTKTAQKKTQLQKIEEEEDVHGM